MKLEDLPGYKSVVFHDVPAVSLVILSPDLPLVRFYPPLPLNIWLHLLSWLLHPRVHSTPPPLRLHLPHVCPIPRPSLVCSPHPPRHPFHLLHLYLNPWTSSPPSSSTPPSRSRPLMHCFTRDLRQVWTRWG